MFKYKGHNNSYDFWTGIIDLKRIATVILKFVHHSSFSWSNKSSFFPLRPYFKGNHSAVNLIYLYIQWTMWFGNDDTKICIQRYYMQNTDECIKLHVHVHVYKQDQMHVLIL